jgi:hypothetical protein
MTTDEFDRKWSLDECFLFEHDHEFIVRCWKFTSDVTEEERKKNLDSLAETWERYQETQWRTRVTSIPKIKWSKDGQEESC